MWAEWLRSILDVVLIGFVGAGLVQATRLLRHLAGLRASRAEMERFVHEFGATVTRAETGIRNLKQAARESGDDLEKLVEKSFMVRDELQFIVESADQLAERLTQAAAGAVRPETHRAESRPVAAPAGPPVPIVAESPKAMPAAGVKEPSSRAEKELMQALRKLS